MKIEPQRAADKSQLVTFLIGRETYGIDIFRIQEVLHFQEVTAVPHAPEFVEGVIRVRERVIPVVDLKKRLRIEGEGPTRRRIVILDLPRPLGVIVDDISKVLMLESSCFEALPEAVIGDQDKACIARLAKTDDGLVIVLAPDRILSRHENEALEQFKAEPEGELTG